MYKLLGGLQLGIVLYVFHRHIKRKDFCVFVDGIKIMMLLWLGNIALYNLQVSELYKPTIMINIVVGMISILMFIIARKISLTKLDVKNLISNFEISKYNKLYSYVTTGVFILASIIFLININKYGLAILGDNKIEKQRLGDYDAYIIYMLALVGQAKYILFRNTKKIHELGIFILSLGMLVLTLNRGPIAYVAITILIFEFFKFINNFGDFSKNKKITLGIILFGFIVLCIWGFGYIGDLRMEGVLAQKGITINQHYRMPSWIPSSLVWVYIYLTSPLENAAFAIAAGGVDLTFLNKLFYPFIKLFNNLTGNGENYKMWLESRGQYEPYLWKEVGLNAKSFIPDAMQDLGVFGVAIYLVLYIGLIVFGIYVLKNRKRFSAIGAILIYTNIISIILWSVFQNSLSIPILILNIMFVVFIEGIINFIEFRKNK